MKKTPLALASDHGGFQLKSEMIQFLKETHPHLELLDLGTDSEASVHYPDFAKKLCKTLLTQQAELGLLFCGTGIGISIAANRFKGIRAALVYDEFTAQMAKAHNNANVLCLGGRTTPPQIAKKLITTWLTTKFEDGRHQDRLNLIDQ